MRKKSVFYIIILILGLGFISCTKKSVDKKGRRFLASTPNENLICEDLFSAACLNPDGTLKDIAQEQQAQINDIMVQAQDRALTAMGFNSLEEAYLDRIAKAGGFEIDPENNSGFNLGLGVDSCNGAAISGNNQSRHDGILNQYYSENLDEFILYIAEVCRNAGYSPSGPAGDNEEHRLCASQLTLRTQVSNIYRLPEAQRREQSTQFVQANSALILPIGFTEGERPSAMCSRAEEIQNIRLDMIDSQLREEIQTSRPFVETVIDQFYSPENVRLANAQFEDSKRQLQSIYNEINPNSPNAENFQRSMANLRLQTLQRPAATEYIQNENGTMVLRPDSSNFLSPQGETHYSMFSDLTLSSFRQMNAYYSSPVEIVSSIGNYSDSGHIGMNPILWSMIGDQPNVFYTILSHEVGHKFSPNNSSYEEFGDLNEKLEELYVCFSQSESVAMTDAMKSEVIADYVSAEMLARRISRETNTSIRRQMLLDSMGDLCSFENMNLHSGYMPNRNNIYPSGNHRCSGIYGANPNIRSLIGCEGESSNYKSCGLGLSLGPSSAPSDPSSNLEQGVQ